MTLAKLSQRQADVLDAIMSHRTRYQTAPTFREIGDMLGIPSTNGVADHIKALVHKGYLKRGQKGTARNLIVTQSGRRRRHADRVALIPSHIDGGKSLRIDRALLPDGDLELVWMHVTEADAEANDRLMDDAGLWVGDVLIVQLGRALRLGDLYVQPSGQPAICYRYSVDSIGVVVGRFGRR